MNTNGQDTPNTSHVLGLNLGAKAIGWALIEPGAPGKEPSIIASGVRVFQEVVDPKTRIPKNAQRRAARATRRILARRHARRAQLQRRLIIEGFLPQALGESTRPEAIYNGIGNPYELRRRGLDEALQPHELGRVLTHLCARRGFQSNAKSLLGLLAQEFDDLLAATDAVHVAPRVKRGPKASKEDEEGEVKSAISKLRADIASSGARTLGEFLARLPREERKRGRYTDRQMFKDEFEAIWRAQTQFHERLQSEGFKAAIYDMLFFQRPLKRRKGFAGRCSLEPSRRRAATARLESQRFRILQDINHLAAQDPVTHEYRFLNADERAMLYETLMTQKSLTFGEARRRLRLPKTAVFNLEQSTDRERLIGNTTACALDAILEDRWRTLSTAQQTQLVEDLLTIEDKTHLVKRLREHWGFSREQQYRLAILELEAGYMSHCLKVINRMLPYFEQGSPYAVARVKAGYRYQQQEIALRRLPPALNVANPLVRKTVNESRRLINRLIAVYGKPQAIRVQVALSLRTYGKRGEEYERQQRLKRKANERAREQLLALNITPSRELQLKFRLWEESEGLCLFSGRSISLAQLFSDEVEIEHIMPFARSLDDSYMNKALCFTDERRALKRSRLAKEAYVRDEERWQGLLQRIHKKSIPLGKERRFLLDSVQPLDEVISHQLNDTRFLVIKKYFEKLGCAVDLSRGAHIGDLRRTWALDSLLGEEPEADHRHHVLDAIIVALADRARLKEIAAASAAAEDASFQHGALTLALPWESFPIAVRIVLDGMVISHACNRRITGAFHEETAYGFRAGTGKLHYRKRLDGTFRPKGVEHIADPVIQKLVSERLQAHGGDPKKAFATPLLHLDGKTPIKAVRLARNGSPATMFAVHRPGETRAYKHYELGSNHHIEIFEDEEGNRVGRVVTTMEAARRARRAGEPVIDRHWQGKRFVMSLCINDMVQTINGGALYRVQKIARGSDITLRLDRAATLDRSEERHIARPSTLAATKVVVDTIGRISRAGD